METSNNKANQEEAVDNVMHKIDTLGSGLQNEVGEYNCFLNVIIQVGTNFTYICFRL